MSDEKIESLKPFVFGDRRYRFDWSQFNPNGDGEDEIPFDVVRCIDDHNTAVTIWAQRQDREVTLGEAATTFKLLVEQIADLVDDGYWTFRGNTDKPLAEQTIEHEGW